MSRDAIRQILARGSLQQPIGQNLAYCVSAPNPFFPGLTSEGTFG